MSSMDVEDAFEEIAIIGMSGRFPGAKNIDEFWQNLRDGVESISFFTNEEVESSGATTAAHEDGGLVRAGGILNDIEMFDASFFGFAPREVEIMDPQHRLFLECSWEALESSGYDPETFDGRIAVYGGTGINDYWLNIYANPGLMASVDALQAIIGNEKDHVPTRISYKLNLRGPSINVQTTCSSSLVAVCLASQSLLTYQCDMALAGAASISVPQKSGYLYREGGIMSPDGHCRAFDAKAQGTVSGNGVGVVLLKRLSDALADGDTIHAIIKGSAINNDGSQKIGYTAPSVEGQAEVIAEAIAMARAEPRSITYIETHGTGTPLGDPVEIAALTKVFEPYSKEKNACALGSVKTNVGHLDTAAGVAGLIKTTLSLKHKLLPPSLHFERPNPNINFANGHFYVNTALCNWEATSAPRRAGVSSFGIGGTNAHVILEEAPLAPVPERGRPSELLLLSARSESALETMTSNLVNYLKQHRDANFSDIAFTLQAGRKRFKHRRALVCSDIDDAVQALELRNDKRVRTHVEEHRDRPVAMVFSGQGAQYPGMSRGLYQHEAAFRQQVDLCAQILEPHLGLDLRRSIFSDEHARESAAVEIHQTSITQPALFIVEYSLARLFMEWGINPRAMLGHSIGEYVAACLAGVFSLEDALRLVAVRGRLMQQLPAGAMLVVPLSEQEARAVMGDKLSLAAVNAPEICVISGAVEDVENLEAQLSTRGLTYRRLQTSHAFHSGMLDPILESFTEEVKKTSLKPPQIPFVSNVTGTWITGDEAIDPHYWTKHLRQTVRFADGVAELLKEDALVLLEVGPGQTLQRVRRQKINQDDSLKMLASMRRPQDVAPDLTYLLDTLGKLWLVGVPIDWARFQAASRRQRVPLPTYPFERQRFWIEAQPRADEMSVRQMEMAKKPDIADWFYTPIWKQSLRAGLLKDVSMRRQEDAWMIFIDATGLGASLIERLKAQGSEVVSVVSGEHFEKLGEDEYAINPSQLASYSMLLKELAAQRKYPGTILHLWNVSTDDSSAADKEKYSVEQDNKEFDSLITLAQALWEQNMQDTVRLGIVSNNVQSVTGEETLNPKKAMLLGPCRAISQEYPNIECRSIDISLADKREAVEMLAQQLIAEFAGESNETVIAYRGARRWVQTFDALRLDENVWQPTRLRERGVYLLTHGTGALEFSIAQHLSKTYDAKLVLVEAVPLPAREEWEHWLATHEAENDVCQSIRKVSALEKLGGEIMLASAELTNEEQLRQVIDEARARFGAINGLIYSPSPKIAGMIHLKTAEAVNAAIETDLKAIDTLEKLLRREPLDFIALFSSTASFTGAFSQVDYCTASSVLDALAQARQLSSDNTPTISINWGLAQWSDWRDSLTATVPELQTQLDERREKFGITLEEGAEVFVRAISTALPQVIISAQDFHAVLKEQESLTATDFERALENNYASQATHTRPQLRSDYVAPRNETEQTVAGLWQEVFGVQRIGVNDDFFDLGGNSLLGIQLMSRLRRAFQIELPMNNLFESPTVAGLAAVIADNQLRERELEEVERLLREIESLSSEDVEAKLTGNTFAGGEEM